MSSPKVLIVEDEAIVAMDIEERLQAMGFTIARVAATAKQAIEIATREKPNLVLMDIQIQGDFDGVQTAQHILQTHDLPVIFLTANSDPQTLNRVRNVGPFGYLLKPFEERDLAMAIDVALYRHRVEKELKVSKEWYITTLMCIGDGVIATDSEDRIKFLNPAAERLIWVKGVDVIGRPLREVFRMTDSRKRSVLQDILQDTAKLGIPIELQGYTLSTSASTKSIAVSGSVASICDDMGHGMGVIIVFRPFVTAESIYPELAVSEKG